MAQASKGGGAIKLVIFNEGRPGLLTERGVVDVSALVRPLGGHDAMQALITRYEELKPELARLAAEGAGAAQPLKAVTLKAPVPRAKLLAMGGNFREFGHRKPAPMWGFVKSTDAILGSGGTVVLPEIDANIFHHEAELVVVFGRAGSNIPQERAMDYVFGYTAGVDVSARMPPSGAGGGRDITKMLLSAGKSYNGFAPIGPAIVPKDEVGDAQALDIKLWVNGELRPNYNTSDLAHSIAESIAWATAITPVEPGDVLFMGTNHQGLGALQDGDHVEMEISRIGRLTFNVADPLKRRWPRGVDEVTAADVRNGTGGPGQKSRPLP